MYRKHSLLLYTRCNFTWLCPFPRRDSTIRSFHMIEINCCTYIMTHTKALTHTHMHTRLSTKHEIIYQFVREPQTYQWLVFVSMPFGCMRVRVCVCVRIWIGIEANTNIGTSFRQHVGCKPTNKSNTTPTHHHPALAAAMHIASDQI